ncbi:cell wall protein DAN4-like [Daphnia pulex]|uniref:cell wall protein DAN4-like n=1 Tax=Daphnia pulex TaxID=6669 RepID=UPI001EE0D465|nr:cell wall protein DAN4-like [Daphnia pulex]XP_046461363.1 cell wall protein DAN4-like [Daphnia pulex]
MKVIAIFVLFAVISNAPSGYGQTTLKKTTLRSTTLKATTVKPTTTLKTTTKPTTILKTTKNPTTLKTTKPTTLKTTTKPTTLKTTTKPTTTLKTTAKLTTKTTIRSTTPFPPLSTSRLCVDTNSTASNGVIQPYYNATTGGTSSCLFFIFSPTATRVQISCSSLNITSGSSLNFYEAIEMENVSECNLGEKVANSNTPVVNTVYNSTSNKMAVVSQFGSKDWFRCKWAVM